MNIYEKTPTPTFYGLRHEHVQTLRSAVAESVSANDINGGSGATLDRKCFKNLRKIGWKTFGAPLKHLWIRYP